jgi:tRNA pseudouridine55 synthase
VVCVGHATKLVDHLHELPKAYAATFLLGRSSPSDDLETPVAVEDRPVEPGRDEVEAALAGFRGTILQRPCDYSAVHVGGKRAYRLARKGHAVALEPKRVRIDHLGITAYRWPRLAVDVVCSSGTFIRAIGRDLAAAVGTTAVMESLVRTAVGPFPLAAAVPLDSITPETVRAALLPCVAAVPHLGRVTLAGERLDRAVRGGLIDVGVPDAALAAVDQAGELVGILKRHESGGHRLRPNFHGLG